MLLRRRLVNRTAAYCNADLVRVTLDVFSWPNEAGNQHGAHSVAAGLGAISSKQAIVTTRLDQRRHPWKRPT